ncbi:hypothetical protein NKR23_g9456 [Pleurostoma richardsiae]|uniref:Myb-like domain-containing protein n=1 Tax=Pleurostoma richardsiae TaxID=41990 RepID=A0AA38VJV4_9PEZI|nr:hypothetical protein NKR23_g9456 [Pleurostoma richardsiae]
MESMVLDDGPVSSSPWSASANEAGFCVPAFTVDSPPWPGAVSHLEATVSPKLLRIVPTPTPTSSTDSVHTTFFTGEGDPDSHFLPFGPPPLGQHAPQALAHPPPMAKPHQQSKNRRRQLPDRAPQPRQKTPTSPAMAKAKSRQVVRSGQASITSPAPKLEPRPAHMPPSYVANTPVDNRSKTRKDEFLINSKMSGMTYKEIKRVGKFAEAESTLRGRFRTLTKNKEARVRKPGWEEKDDQLLRRAVQELEKGGKIPWKLVAEYIVRNGGSYHFGNTTCRKRWDLLIDEDGDML